MKRSKAVTIGATVALLVSQLGAACDDEEPREVQTQYGEICVRTNTATGEDVRLDDDECDRGNSGAHWIWINHGYSGGYAAPAKGGVVAKGAYTTTKPAGVTIARPPATGGFGTHMGTGG